MVDVLVLGSLNADFVFKLHQIPRVGETVHSYEFLQMLGGKGGNQAAAVARLGGKVGMAGRLGNDAFGPASIENLRQQGVDISHIKTDREAPTGTAVGLVSDTGENIIVVSAGANGTVSKTDVDDIVGVLAETKLLLLQFEIPTDTVEYALEMAARYPVKTILNPAPAYYVPPEFLAKVDYLIPNETEASTLTGLDVKDLPSAEMAARRFLECGVPVAIITLGERGALVANDQQIAHIPARKVEAIDTVAAGDAFIGGFAVALVKGFALAEAVRYANCAASIAVTRSGAQPSLPWAEEAEAAYAIGGSWLA